MAKPAFTLRLAWFKSHQFSLHPREYSHQPDGKAWIKDSFKRGCYRHKGKSILARETVTCLGI